MGQSTYEALVFIRNVNLFERNVFSVSFNKGCLVVGFQCFMFSEPRIQGKIIDLFSYILWKATPSYEQLGEWAIH
jgi:hypothetical protein